MRPAVLMLLLAACSSSSPAPSPSPSPPPAPAPSPPPYLGVNIVSRTAWPIQGMAVDGTTLYWMAAGTLRAIPKDGGLWRTIAAGASPSSSLVVSNGFVWWLDATEIRRVSIGGGQVEVVRSAITPKPPFFTVLGDRAFWVEASTNRVMNDLGAVIADPDGAPWGLGSSANKVFFACDDSIQSAEPDGSNSVRIAAFINTMHRRYGFAVSTEGPIFVDETGSYGSYTRLLVVVGGTSTPLPSAVRAVTAFGGRAYLLAAQPPPPPKPPCGLFDKNCQWFDSFDFATDTVVLRSELAGTYSTLTDVPYELDALAADAEHVYFGRPPNLLSEAEIDRIP